MQQRRLQVIAFLCTTSIASAAHAVPAAQVEFAMGDPVAVSAAGRERVLHKGDAIESGDLVNTKSGRAQLRFSDGAYVSLQPDTQFRIDEYRYDGKSDGSERGFFSLLKGGLRTITGLVGRAHKRNYQITTTVATIGIRGTEYTLSLNGGLKGSVGEGEIQVCNTGGCQPVTSGQSFVVVQPDAKPSITSKKSDLPPAQPTTGVTSQFVNGDTVSSSGLPLGVTPFKDGPGYALVYAKDGGGGPAGVIATGQATFDSTAGLQSYLVTGGKFDRGPATIAKNEYDLFITYGAWTGQYLQNGASFPLQSNQAFHYVVGIPTPQSAFTGTATYTMVGNSGPSGDNNLTGQLLSASLIADLTLGKLSTSLSLQYGPWHYLMTGSGLVINKSTATFSGTVSLVGCAAGTGCGSSVTGFFAGPNAQNAGLAYHISDFSGGTFNVGGVVAFKRQ
jgi:hypothetical protein